MCFRRFILFVIIIVSIVFCLSVGTEAQWSAGVFVPEPPRFTLVLGRDDEGHLDNTVFGALLAHKIGNSFQVVWGANVWVQEDESDYFDTIIFPIVGLGIRRIIPMTGTGLKVFLFGEIARGGGTARHEGKFVMTKTLGKLSYGGGVLKSFKTKLRLSPMLWFGLARDHSIVGGVYPAFRGSVGWSTSPFSNSGLKYYIGGKLNLSRRFSIIVGADSSVDGFNPSYGVCFGFH